MDLNLKKNSFFIVRFYYNYYQPKDKKLRYRFLSYLFQVAGNSSISENISLKQFTDGLVKSFLLPICSLQSSTVHWKKMTIQGDLKGTGELFRTDHLFYNVTGLVDETLFLGKALVNLEYAEELKKTQIFGIAKNHNSLREIEQLRAIFLEPFPIETAALKLQFIKPIAIGDDLPKIPLNPRECTVDFFPIK